MFRALAALACFVGVTGTPRDGTCVAAAGAGPCAPALVGDHSLLQVHPATKQKKHSKEGTSQVVGAKLQQKKAIQNERMERHNLDGKVEQGSESKSGMDPYPEDYDLDTDYPHDLKGTRADTVRELQSATLPGDGDIGKNTKPGLSDSWNVDKMFVTDSDGGGHVSLRDMIPWGYRSQNKPVQKRDDKDDSGLLSKETDSPNDQRDEDEADAQAGEGKKRPNAIAALPEANDMSEKKVSDNYEHQQKRKHGRKGEAKDEGNDHDTDSSDVQADGDANAAAEDRPDSTAALPEGKDKEQEQVAEKDGAKQKDDHKDDLKSDLSEGNEDEDESDGDADATAKDKPNTTAALPEGDSSEQKSAEKDAHEDKHAQENTAEKDEPERKDAGKDETKDEEEGEAHARGRAKDGPDSKAALPEAKDKAKKETAERDQDKQKDYHNETAQKDDDEQKDLEKKKSTEIDKHEDDS